MIRYNGKQKHLEPYKLAFKMLIVTHIMEIIFVGIIFITIITLCHIFEVVLGF